MSRSPSRSSTVEKHPYQKYIVLAASLLCSLAAGTNYGFSAYAPQLAEKLNLTSTQLNLIGTFGNVGNYSFSPLIGPLIDARGPAMPFFMAVAFVLIGYGGTYLSYIGAIHSSNIVPILVFFGFLIGAGSSSAMMAALNATGKSFPDSSRASAAALVFGGFGLSAFFYTSLARSFFEESTTDFLLLLTFLPSICFFIGFFFARPVEESDSPSEKFHRRKNQNRYQRIGTEDEEDDVIAEAELAIPLDERQTIVPVDGEIYGWALLKNVDFWMVYTVFVVLSGCGLMYINNIGTISNTLFSHKGAGNPLLPDPHRYQSQQVSLISIFNSLGRFLTGLVSDHVRNTYGFDRVWFLPIVALLFILAQTAAIYVQDVDKIFEVSIVLGYAYGGLFFAGPILIMEFFGISKWARNLGILMTSPIIGGNIFSILFGKNYDSHLPEGSKTCSEGPACYVAVFYQTRLACVFALMLSLFIAWKRLRFLKEAQV